MSFATASLGQLPPRPPLPAVLRVVNETKQQLKLSLVGPFKREIPFGDIPPGEDADGAAIVGQQFVVRDANTGEVVKLIDVSQPAESIVIGGKEPDPAPNAPKTKNAKLKVTNRSAGAVSVVIVSDGGEERKLPGTLAAGETRTLSAQVGRTVKFHDENGQQLAAHTLTRADEEIDIGNQPAPKPARKQRPRPVTPPRPKPEPTPEPAPEPTPSPDPTPEPAKTVVVPRMIGMTLEDATAKLGGDLVAKGIANGPAPTPEQAGKVSLQQPRAGARVAAGATVTLRYYEAPQPAPKPDPMPEPSAVKSYWLGRKAGPGDNRILYDVAVPDYFVEWMKEATPVGGGANYQRTIDGATYTFTKQSFRWTSQLNPTSTGQIAIKSDATTGLEWKRDARLKDQSVANLRQALISLARPLANNNNWSEIETATMVEANGDAAPGIIVEPSAPFDTVGASSEQTGPTAETPQILATRIGNSWYVAWQKQGEGDAGGPMLTRFDSAGDRWIKAWTKPMTLDLLGGFASDGSQLYVLTTKDEDLRDDMRTVQYRSGVVELAKYDADGNEVWHRNLNSPDYLGPPSDGKADNAFYSPMTGATGCMAYGDGKLAITMSSNGLPSDGIRHQHATFLMVDADGNGYGGGTQTSWRHSFDQRVSFDGSDFVFMDLADDGYLAGAGIAMRKIKFADGKPQYTDNLEGTYIYARLGDGNFSYTSMGDFATLDDGYVAVFSSERRNDTAARQGFSKPVLDPRNLALVHVVKDFDLVEDAMVTTANKSQPHRGNVDITYGSQEKFPIRITGNVVDSPGPSVTIARPGQPEAKVTQKGIVWLTNYRAGVSVERPKIARVGDNEFVLLWEEWSYLGKELTYQSTHAMLVDRQGNVIKPAQTIQARLCPGGADRAVGADGSAVFFSGDAAAGKITLYKVDRDLNVTGVDLEL